MLPLRGPHPEPLPGREAPAEVVILELGARLAVRDLPARVQPQISDAGFVFKSPRPVVHLHRDTSADDASRHLEHRQRPKVGRQLGSDLGRVLIQVQLDLLAAAETRGHDRDVLPLNSPGLAHRASNHRL